MPREYCFLSVEVLCYGFAGIVIGRHGPVSVTVVCFTRFGLFLEATLVKAQPELETKVSSFFEACLNPLSLEARTCGLSSY
jgi:hypothetical protein